NAWSTFTNRPVTSYFPTLFLAAAYRAVAGGYLSVQNGLTRGFDSVKYETATGKVAFVDHGWHLYDSLLSEPPVEASLGESGTPSFAAFPTGPLGFRAGNPAIDEELYRDGYPKNEKG